MKRKFTYENIFFRKILYLFSLLLSVFFSSINSSNLSAQQVFQSTNFQLDKYDINPAYAGMDNALNITSRYRNQWQGLPGNPSFLKLNTHLPLYSFSGGTGLQVWNQSIGYESNVHFNLSYNQVFPLPFGLVSVGLRMGVINKAINGDKFISAFGNYENGALEHNDDHIPRGRINSIAPSWGIGLYFFSKFTDFGIVLDEYPQVGFEIEGFKFRKRNSITIHWNYFLNLPERTKMEAFLLLRSDFIQWQSEMGIAVHYEENVFLSCQLRGYNENTLDAVSFGVGGMLNKKIRLAYNYDITLSKLSQVSNGAHEFQLSYFIDVNFGKKIPEKIIHSPRLFE